MYLKSPKGDDNWRSQLDRAKRGARTGQVVEQEKEMSSPDAMF